MKVPRALQNMIQLANSLGAAQNDKKINLSAMIITPQAQIPLILPSEMAKLSLYSINSSDDFRIKGELQPGVLFNQVLPYRDNLYIEVTERIGLSQTMRRYRANPVYDGNPEMAGNSVHLSNLQGLDETNLTQVRFQLMEVGYAILKTVMISDKHLMTTLGDALHIHLTRESRARLQHLTGADIFRGVNIEQPIDNPKVFQTINIPSAIPLKDLAKWLQEDDRFGIYTKGLGSYFQKGMWYVGPLFKAGRYETGRRVLNIYRVPEDVIPTLEASYFVQGRVITIMSTGKARHIDGTDILKQNQGTGKRVISSDALMGEVGYYYGKGQAAITREDTLSEYRTSIRASGEEMAPFAEDASNNLAVHLSANAARDGTMETLSWHNSDHNLLEPFMPVRFYYMSGTGGLKYKEGTLLAARSDLQKDNQHPKLVFREHSALNIFLNNEEIVVE